MATPNLERLDRLTLLARLDGKGDRKTYVREWTRRCDHARAAVEAYYEAHPEVRGEKLAEVVDELCVASGLPTYAELMGSPPPDRPRPRQERP